MTYGDIFLYSVAFLRNITFCKKLKAAFLEGLNCTRIYIFTVYIFFLLRSKSHL